VFANLQEHIDSNFEYFFAVTVLALIFRIIGILQFNEKVGPLFKIVSKLSVDFFYFCIIYLLMALMFSILININFLDEIEDYETFTKSFFAVMNASLGNYDFSIFDNVSSSSLKLFG